MSRRCHLLLAANQLNILLFKLEGGVALDSVFSEVHLIGLVAEPACVPCMQAKQNANEFIVLNAGAYHSGFNLGFNCAEAVGSLEILLFVHLSRACWKMDAYLRNRAMSRPFQCCANC